MGEETAKRRRAERRARRGRGPAVARIAPSPARAAPAQSGVRPLETALEEAPTVPSWALWSALVIICGALLAAAFGEPERPAAVAPTATRALLLHDLADGALSVRDAARGGVEIARLDEGDAGFVRSAARSLLRQRRTPGRQPDARVDLALYPDGRLSLTDPSGGARIELNGFGADNRAAFARLLEDAPGGGARLGAAPAAEKEPAS